MNVCSMKLLVVCVIIFAVILNRIGAQSASDLNHLSGDDLYIRGKDLTAVGRHEEAATLFWGALMKAGSAETYKTEEAFEAFLTTYQRRDILDEGYFSVAKKYAGGNQIDEATAFAVKALEANPSNRDALELLKELDPAAAKAAGKQAKASTKAKKNQSANSKNKRINRSTGEVNDYTGLMARVEASPEDANVHLAIAHEFFSNREWSSSLHHYAVAYNLSVAHYDEYLEEALSHGDLGSPGDERLVNKDLCYSVIAYLKSSLGMWGSPDSTGQFNMLPNILDNDYATDMQELENLVRREMNTTMLRTEWVSQSSVLHPHMTLGFPIDPDVKLRVAKSHAVAELALVKKSALPIYRYEEKERARYHAAAFDKKEGKSTKTRNNNHNLPGRAKMLNFKLNDDTADSRAWDKRAIEPPSKAVGWTSVPGAKKFAPGFRIRVGYVSANIKAKSTVYMAQDLMRFHDRSRFEVHVYATTPQDSDAFLKGSMRGIDWRKKVHDGVEFFHEVQGMKVDRLAELIRSHNIHILLNWDGYSNNGVRATGLFPLQAAPVQVAHQEYIGTMGADYIQYLIADEVAIPPRFAHHYTEKFIYMPHSFLANSFSYQRPYMFEPTRKYDPHNNPQKNACGRSVAASFVYCNFNKHLKFSPELFKIWLRVLQSVDDSMLCLLENPSDSIPYIYDYIRQFDDSLVDRVRFQPFLPNPYDNQRRGALMCNAVLDSQIYNGHTTAGDALWGGVPILTYGEDEGMAGRVGASALTALGLEELIVHSHVEYFDKAVRLGSDKSYFGKLRGKLVDSCLQHPRSPFWDMRRYVRSLENGFEKIWRDFLDNAEPRTMYAVDPLNRPTNSGAVANSTDPADSDTEKSRKGKNTKGEGKSSSKLKKKSKRSKKSKKNKNNKKSKKDKGVGKKSKSKSKKSKRGSDEL